MESVDNEKLLFFVDFHLLIGHALEWLIKPLLEIITGSEYFRKQEIEQSPQLTQVILQRGARE